MAHSPASPLHGRAESGARSPRCRGAGAGDQRDAGSGCDGEPAHGVAAAAGFRGAAGGGVVDAERGEQRGGAGGGAAGAAVGAAVYQRGAGAGGAEGRVAGVRGGCCG